MTGAVFCIEASRLARNGRDWHHLIDLCALVGKLVIDPDGTYDPRLVNDRLLLGLKGTMSELLMCKAAALTTQIRMGAAVKLIHLAHPEIGRASCRERVLRLV